MIHQKEIQFESGEIGYEISLVIEKECPPYLGDEGYEVATTICEAFNIPIDKLDEIASLSRFAKAYEDLLDDIRQFVKSSEIDTMLDNLNTEG